MERIKPKKVKYKTISLFSGIGGFDLGFMYAGFNIIWANDFEKYACQTYRENVSNNIVCGNIREEKKNIPSHDILIGGFPCQPFSTLGKLQGFDDQEGRGTLFFEIKDIIQKHHTKVVVLENVKNIMNHDEGRTFKRIIKELNDIGYITFSHVFNSQDYGVPQRRNRCYIVAFSGEYFDIKDKDLPWPPAQELKVTTKNFYHKDAEIDLPIARAILSTQGNTHRASVNNYVTTNGHIRALEPRESLRLMGFPDSFKIVVSRAQSYKQSGNSIVVDVLMAITTQILKAIGE